MPSGRGGVFHLHVAKMAGRSVMSDAPRVLELPRCRWQAAGFYGNQSDFAARARAAHGPPCFSSYEASWGTAVPALAATVAVATLLRSPVDWALSAASHFDARASLDELVTAGCFWEPGQGGGDRVCGASEDGLSGATNALMGCGGAACAAGYNFPYLPIARLVDARLAAGLLRGNSSGVARAVTGAKRHLAASMVGLTEHYAASLCLWRHQLGLSLHAHPCSALCRGRGAEHLVVSHVKNERRGGDGAPPAASAATVRAIERAMGPYAEVYAWGKHLFRQRVASAEAATGVRLLC